MTGPRIPTGRSISGKFHHSIANLPQQTKSVFLNLVNPLFGRRAAKPDLPVSLAPLSGKSLSSETDGSERENQESVQFRTDIKAYTNTLFVHLGQTADTSLKDALESAATLFPTKFDNHDMDLVGKWMTEALTDISERHHDDIPAIDERLQSEEVCTALCRSDAGKCFLNAVKSLQVEFDPSYHVRLRLDNATAVLQSPANHSFSDCLSEIKTLASVLEHAADLAQESPFLPRDTVEEVAIAVLRKFERETQGMMHLLTPDTIAALCNAMRRVTNLISPARHTDVGAAFLRSALAHSNNACASAVSELMSTLRDPKQASNAVKTLSRVAGVLARHDALVKGLRGASIGTDSVDPAMDKLPENLSEWVSHHLDLERGPVANARALPNIPTDLFLLQHALNTGRRSVATDPTVSPAARAEIANADTLLSTVMTHWMETRPLESVDTPDLQSLSTPLRRGIAQTFGLEVNRTGYGMQSIRRTASNLFSDWRAFVGMQTKERHRLEKRSSDESVSAIHLPQTIFAGDVPRCHFIIANEVLDPTATGNTTAMRDQCVTRIKDRLTRITGGDGVSAAHLVSWLDMNAVAIFSAINQPGVNSDAHKELSRLRSQPERMVTPSHGESGNGNGTTFVIDPLADGRIRLEVRFQTQANVGMQPWAKESEDSLALFEPDTSFWFGRYAVILAPDGSETLDGPVETHNTWVPLQASH